MVKKKVTQKLIEEKTSELCDLIDQFDGSKADAASHVCFQVVTAACECHYHGLGILQETLLEWREASLEVLPDECDKPSVQ